MKSKKVIAALLLFIATFTACKKDNQVEPELPTPTLENLELGLGDAGIGIIGQDFHFEGDIVAVDKIDKVEVKMLQKSSETYSKAWKHEIVWDQYKGLKNTNIHKHFNIPDDAAAGKYDLIITVYDENGSKLEVKRDFEIYTAANLPVRPTVTGFFVHKNWTPFYDLHSDKDKMPTNRYKKGDTIHTQVNIAYTKGDGKLYLLLIKKSSNYNPRTIEEVDLSKAIVYDVMEFKNDESVTNFVFDPATFTTVREIPPLVIGAEKDNNAPNPNTISGNKAWQTGDYNLVLIYKNTTYNKTVHKAITFGIDYN